MTVRTAFVRRVTAEGQFSNEYAVSVTTKAGNVLSFFADKAPVHPEDQGEGLLRVQVIENGDSSGVLLPAESFEEGSRWADLELVAP